MSPGMPGGTTPPDEVRPPARADRRPLLGGLAIGAVLLLGAVAIALSGHRSGDEGATLAVTGGLRHDLAFPNGPASRMLDPGDGQRLDLDVVTTSRTGCAPCPGTSRPA